MITEEKTKEGNRLICRYMGWTTESVLEGVHFYKNQWRIPEFLKHLTEADMHHYDNLMPTCRVCNKWKSTFTIDQFKKEVFEQVKRLNDYSTNYRMAKKYELIVETVKPIIFYFEREEILNK